MNDNKKIEKIIENLLKVVNQESRKGADSFEIIEAIGNTLSIVITDCKVDGIRNSELKHTAIQCLSRNLDLYMEPEPLNGSN